MTKFLKNERGLTLIELLAAASLTAMISVFAIGLLLKGMNHYNVISTDTAFRDEADILMVSLVKELYTTKESDILTRPSENCTENCYFLMKGEKKSGFVGNDLLIQDKSISTTNSKINISSESKIEQSSYGVYQVKLVLEMPIKNQDVTFENEVRTINDVKSEAD
ncbi:hypothetical protein [Sporosarcina sp. 6E9]|uniref:hypothetical protein n=1 Tax=Sporosarcina sp. 6E9 TaxID=2819235 RepID=UPI001ACC04CA|nr:hypothetical protein [Sporosarcina sp. 6E9]MBO1911927.1 hypothetical protein [Microvirga sp. 3-52]